MIIDFDGNVDDNNTSLSSSFVDLIWVEIYSVKMIQFKGKTSSALETNIVS